ncbi:putative phosphoglycerate mutase [Xylariaceae sp. FL1272]|nr:putative phosphoglycerate mutase [Xylariaceae sp. FL1272]
MSDANATTPRVFLARHGLYSIVSSPRYTQPINKSFPISLGETEWTISGKCTGNAEISMTQNGVKQVKATGEMLVGHGKLIDPSSFARVFCSPRKRAVETLEMLLGETNQRQLEQEDKIAFTEDIAEWDYGTYEGKTPSEIKAERQEQGLGKWNIWTGGCPDGETPQQVQERLDRLIKQIVRIQEPFMKGGPAPNILVIAHGHILRAFTKRWLKYPMDFEFTMMMEPGAIGILSYAHHSVYEPAILVGMGLPISA